MLLREFLKLVCVIRVVFQINIFLIIVHVREGFDMLLLKYYLNYLLVLGDLQILQDYNQRVLLKLQDHNQFYEQFLLELSLIVLVIYQLLGQLLDVLFLLLLDVFRLAHPVSQLQHLIHPIYVLMVKVAEQFFLVNQLIDPLKLFS